MTFSIKKSFKDSWAMFSNKKIYWKFIATNFLAVAGLYIAFGLSAFVGAMVLSQGNIILFAVILIVAILLALYFLLVNVHIPLAVYHTKHISIKKIFKSAWSIKMIGQTIGMFILLALVVGLGGFALFWIGGKISPILGMVLAGVWAGYFAIRWAFSLYALVDLKLGSLDALKKSNTLMKNNGWKFLVFVVIVSVISIVLQNIIAVFGFISPSLPGVVSVLFAIFFAPWFSLLSVSPYIQLTHHNHS